MFEYELTDASAKWSLSRSTAAHACAVSLSFGEYFASESSIICIVQRFKPTISMVAFGVSMTVWACNIWPAIAAASAARMNKRMKTPVSKVEQLLHHAPVVVARAPAILPDVRDHRERFRYSRRTQHVAQNAECVSCERALVLARVHGRIGEDDI